MNKKQYTIAVIDGQGGSLGKTLVKRIKKEFPRLFILAIGTNSIATSNMLTGVPDAIATGENPVIVGARKSNIIIGAIGIIIADALHGEITAKMASAIGASEAHKILIPISKCNTSIAGTEKIGLENLIKDCMELIKNQLIEKDITLI
ncbi:MAG: DUF3842 family protein [Spirochaetaceae bacterium]|nr:DUF3842 family protein [Spirochaetaceae bacterium]